MVLTITESSLGRREDVAAGAFGMVFRVSDLHPIVSGRLAYKKFTCDVRRQARSAERAVQFRDGLSAADRNMLDSFAAWPLALVSDGSGAICGFVMPLLALEFFCDQLDPDTMKMTSKPREMSWLITTAKQRDAAKIDLEGIELTDRLMLLAKLVYAIGWLHKNGWVFGDLSFKNVAFAVNPLAIQLIDCDGTAEACNLTRQQYSTPFWDPPECPNVGQGSGGSQLQDCISDVYKLALAIVRCLTPGKGASQARSINRIVDELDASGRDLLARALSSDRTARPTAKEIYAYLHGVVSQRVAAPTITVAHLDQALVIRGMDARIQWAMTGASKVRIRGANALAIDVDPQLHSAGYTFRPDASGRVSIEAANKYGAVSVDCGDLTLYEVPAFDMPAGVLPRIAIPSLSPISLPQALSTFDLRPRIGVGYPTIPVGTAPPTYDALLGIRPFEALDLGLRPLVPTFSADIDDIGATVRAGTQQFSDLLRDSLSQSAATARSTP